MMGRDQQNSGIKQELLELIAEKMGVNYLSDLRRTKQVFDCYRAIVQIEADAYTVSEWQDAVAYILEVRLPMDTSAGAKAWFLNCLRKLSGF